MNAGKRKTRIVIRSFVATQLDDGTPSNAPADFAVRGCERNDEKGQERIVQSGELGTRATRLRMTYIAGVTQDMTVRLDGEDWDIRSIAEIGHRKTTELVCELRSR